MAVNWNKNLKDWMTNSYNPAPNIDIQNARTDTEDYTDNAHPVQQAPAPEAPQAPPAQYKPTNNVANIFKSLGHGLFSGTTNLLNNIAYLSEKSNPYLGKSKIANLNTLKPQLDQIDNTVNNLNSQFDKEGQNNFAYGMAKSLPSLGLAFIPGVGLGLSAANSAAEGGRQAQEAGKGEMAQLGNAVTKGALNYGLMKLPVGSLGGEIGGTLGSKLGSIAKTAGLGAGAGGVGSIGNTITNKAFVNPNEQFNSNDILSNALMGGVLGGGFKGVEAFRPGLKPPTNPSSDIAPLPKETPSTNDIKPITNPLSSEASVLNNVNNTETIKPSIGANDRTQSGQAIVTGKNNSSLKTKLNDLKQQAKINLYDINAPIENINKDTYKLATNSKKAGGTVSHILNNNLVDMKGNTIGEGLQSIAKDIPRNQEKDFFNYVLQKHNIDRARQETKQVAKTDNQGFLVKDKNGNQVYNDVVTKKATPIFTDFTPEQSQKAVNLIEQRHPEYKAIGDRLTKFINNFENEWGNKSGLINNDLWKSIQDTYKNYIPTQRSFTELEKGAQATAGNGFVDQGNTLKRATGSERDIINPVENIANLVNRTVRTARYNEVGQSLLNAVENNPQAMSKYAELIPSTEKINPNIDNVVSVLRNGEPVNIQINDKNLLEALQGLNKNIDFNAAEKVLGKLNTGFKALITTKNPVFALRNMARDLPTAYVYGNEHNPLKFGANYLGAMKSLITNDAAAQQYKALGGESANFFNSDRAYKTANELMNRKLVSDKTTGEITGSKKINPVLKTLKGVNNGVEKFNNIIESAPRLAEFKNTLKKGGNVQDALYNSGEITTNFSRGGKAVKRLDNSVPYLNASMQGLGKFGEQITKKPIQTLAKGIVSTTIPALALQAMNSNNPNYKNLDNRTKDNYFIFPNATGPKDSQGNPETFVKIPKSRELGALFGSLAERVVRQSNGDPQAFKGIGSTIATNISPTNPLNNNIFAPIAINLPTNKDFAGRTIVPMSMQDRTPKYQYDENTSNIAKGIGQLTGLSPKQIDYVVKSYTGVIGQMAENATTPSNYISKNSGANIFMPVTGQFKSDVLYNNQNLQDFYDNMDKAKTAAADKNFVDNVPSKDITPEETINSGFTRASKAMSELSKAADQATREGDINQARQFRMQMLQIAQDANKGTFPLTATQQKAATKSTSTKSSSKTSPKLQWKK